jgi:hypothetical protein
MIEQRILGKLYLKSTFGPFLRNIYESKTAGAVLLKMMIQYLPLVLYLFDEEDKEQFYTKSNYNFMESERFEEDQEEEPNEIDKTGILGGFLSKKKTENKSDHPLQFFVKFILKCLKVCDEKRKLEALMRIDLIMKKLSKKNLQEKVFVQLSGFLKAGNSAEVTLQILNLLKRWIARFPCNLRKRIIAQKLEEFLLNENVNNVKVYEELFALWEAMELESNMKEDMGSVEYQEYVRVLEILLIQKRIGENLAEKVFEKWQKLLILMKEKNRGIEASDDLDLGDLKKEPEPIMKMFMNYKLTDHEVEVLDGQEKKKEKKIENVNYDLGINKEEIIEKEVQFKFGKKKEKEEKNVDVDDLLDLTNFGDKMESIEPFEKKRSSKKKKRRKKNILNDPGLKLRKKKSKKKESSNDLLDFSIPESNNAPLSFDMDKLKNDLSLFDEHKKTKEDNLINSFFDKGNTGFKGKEKDDDKLQRYFSKPNSENLEDFI